MGEPILALHFLKGASKSIIGLSGRLVAETVAQLAGLLPKLDDPRVIEMDLSDLSFLDEDGVRALQFLERRCAGRQTLLLLSYPRPSIRRLLNRAGVRGLLAPSFPTRRITGVVGFSGFNQDQTRVG